jgi:tRNA threonylcarbamoyladenosine biosynthesis protein TsaB
VAQILSIETSTLSCSVSLSENGVEISRAGYQGENYSHAEKLSPLINECIETSSFTLNDLDAIAVCKGPGSYTGLRIGVSTAKGLCFGLNIPLIAMDSTEVLAQMAWQKYPEATYCVPMLDARRMEIYSSSFSREFGRQSECEAIIVDEDSFSDLYDQAVVFLGDAAAKCEEVLIRPNWSFDQCFPSASTMGAEVERRYQNGDFEDVAYFEPYYLKDFIAGKPKDLLRQG